MTHQTYGFFQGTVNWIVTPLETKLFIKKAILSLSVHRPIPMKEALLYFSSWETIFLLLVNCCFPFSHLFYVCSHPQPLNYNLWIEQPERRWNWAWSIIVSLMLSAILPGRGRTQCMVVLKRTNSSSHLEFHKHLSRVQFVGKRQDESNDKTQQEKRDGDQQRWWRGCLQF